MRGRFYKRPHIFCLKRKNFSFFINFFQNFLEKCEKIYYNKNSRIAVWRDAESFYNKFFGGSIYEHS